MKNNIIILQNWDLWKECLQLDLITGEKRMITRIDDLNPSIQGHYEVKDNDCIMVYRKNGLLYFSLNDQETCLDDPNVTVSFIREDRDNNTFTVKDNDRVFYQTTYPSFSYDLFDFSKPFDFTFQTEEDQDLFLFIYNFLNDPRRRRVMYTPYFD
jgi:hypothetical protein